MLEFIQWNPTRIQLEQPIAAMNQLVVVGFCCSAFRVLEFFIFSICLF